MPETPPESIDTAIDNAFATFRIYAGQQATPAAVVAQADGFNRLHNLPGPQSDTRVVARVRGPNWTAVLTFQGIGIELAPGVTIPTQDVSEQVAALAVDGEPLPWPAEVQRSTELADYLQALRTYAASAAENPEDTWAADFIARTVRTRNHELKLPAPPADWRRYRPDNVYRGCGWKLSMLGPYVIYEVTPVV